MNPRHLQIECHLQKHLPNKPFLENTPREMGESLFLYGKPVSSKYIIAIK